MAFRELVSPSLTDLFVKEIEGMILSGELQPGQKLPTERELAREMKVSLAVINGGITRLSAKGFLRVVPRKGVFVADYLRDGNINTLEAMLEYSENYFQAGLLSAIVDFRRLCEFRITEEACQNRTDDSMQILEGLLEKYVQAKDDITKSELGFSFHHEVAIASGNMVYPLILATFRGIYLSFYQTMFSLQGTEPALEHLRTILKCIREKDAEKAIQCLEQSIAHWHYTFQASYQEGQEYRNKIIEK